MKKRRKNDNARKDEKGEVKEQLKSILNPSKGLDPKIEQKQEENLVEEATCLIPEGFEAMGLPMSFGSSKKR